ncbi:MAG TPA: hypothetical protein ENJ18_07485 [Nannocystis exedens]|nr:hypothetical protein [Nannocystis exedens]
MRSWSGLVACFGCLFSLCVVSASVVGGCAVENPGWLDNPTDSASGTSTSTGTSTATSTSSTTETTTAEPEPLACPNPDSEYCPYFVDLADTSDNCPATDSYVARREGTTFYRCTNPNGSCDEVNCPMDMVALDLPSVYNPVLMTLNTPCISVVHELATIDGICRTRSLVVWPSDADTSVEAPKIILAAHTPDAPKILDDLSISVEAEQRQCDCGPPCKIDFALGEEFWCCENKLSLGTYRISTGGTVERRTYGKFVTATEIQYRGKSFDFIVTQGHEACDGSGFQAGWYMTKKTL